MLGWLILFGLIAAVGAALGFSGTDSAVPMRAGSVVFAVLFVICAVGHAIRRWAQ